MGQRAAISVAQTKGGVGRPSVVVLPITNRSAPRSLRPHERRDYTRRSKAESSFILGPIIFFTKGNSGKDYDRLAESLLLKAAELDYPNPTRINALADFYRDQELKLLARVVSKAQFVEAPSEEMLSRITEQSRSLLHVSSIQCPKLPELLPAQNADLAAQSVSGLRAKSRPQDPYTDRGARNSFDGRLFILPASRGAAHRHS